MAATQIAFLIGLFCAAHNFVPTEGTEFINKITGFVKSEAEYAYDTIKEVAQKVKNIFRPREHPSQPEAGSDAHRPHSSTNNGYVNRQTGQDPSRYHNTAQGPSSSISSTLEEADPDVTYNIDVRNSENGLVGASGTNETRNRFNLNYPEKACNPGQRVDDLGKCRMIN